MPSTQVNHEKEKHTGAIKKKPIRLDKTNTSNKYPATDTGAIKKDSQALGQNGAKRKHPNTNTGAIKKESQALGQNGAKRKHPDTKRAPVTQDKTIRGARKEPLNEATGCSIITVVEHAFQKTPLYYYILEMFPEASPEFISNLCRNYEKDDETTNDIVKYLTENDYPKRTTKINVETVHCTADDQFRILQNIFPHADPNYLRVQVENFEGNPEDLEAFVSSIFNGGQLPTLTDWAEEEKVAGQIREYTEEFDVDKFLQIIPDPKQYFHTTVEKKPYDTYDVKLDFLKTYFDYHSVSQIRKQLDFHNNLLIPAWSSLRQIPSEMKYRRKANRPIPCKNILVIQQMAYLQHYDHIRSTAEKKKLSIQKEIERCKRLKLMKTCECCYNDEVLPANIITCPNGCQFCISCVKRSVVIGYGEGKLQFECLSACSSEFSLDILKQILQPNLFTNISKKKQLQEIKSAQIEGLETCPHCDFASIPSPRDKIFKCFNPECMKETCRLCREPAHLPLNCQEAENDNEVKKRTYIEKKMTEALVRTCYKCGVIFVKEDGCNKMTCKCGAKMCYICKQPVKDYSHFNGNGGDQYHLCPLFSDTLKLHKEEILKSAEEAKVEVGLGKKGLINDPTKDIKKHYDELRKKKSKVENEGHQIPQDAAIRNLNDVVARLRQEVDNLRQNLDL